MDLFFLSFFFTHFVCSATVSTPALIWAPPSRENNELNPQKKINSQNNEEPKELRHSFKRFVSFGSGHQYSLCEAKTDGKQPALYFSA